jgi:NADPH-dependent 7-cyano-7-deazaguanine reductase QueF-like protein
LNTRNFLYDLCKRAIEIDYSVNFVGVVNVDGKLIVGKSKPLIDKQNEIIDKNFFKFCLNSLNNKFSNGTTDLDQSINKNKNTLFYSKLFDRLISI